jgi:hypothetical protein
MHTSMQYMQLLAVQSLLAMGLDHVVVCTSVQLAVSDALVARMHCYHHAPRAYGALN